MRGEIWELQQVTVDKTAIRRWYLPGWVIMMAINSQGNLTQRSPNRHNLSRLTPNAFQLLAVILRDM
ncbi:hypothetical protein [Pelotomaculum propionicicum]|uniref:hypothetical protein n=1 Tax=Pelotomaculum propionicicum TaxID=258475 RepID=UPI003BA0427E